MELDLRSMKTNTRFGFPKWARFILHIYAFFIFLSSIVILGSLGFLIVTRGSDIINIFPAVPYQNLIFLGVVFAGAVILMLQIFYCLELAKMKRWTLPMVWFSTFGSTLAGVMELFRFEFVDSVEVVGSLIGMLFVFGIGVVTLLYRRYFEGPWKKLRFQIPLLIFLIPATLFSLLGYIITDDAEINDKNVVPAEVEVPKAAHNMYENLLMREDLDEEESEKFKSALLFASEIQSTNEDNDINYIEAYQHMIATKDLSDSFILASKKATYVCPTSANNFTADALDCDLNYVRELAQLTALRVEVELYFGDIASAFDSAMSIIDIGNLLIDAEQPTFVEYVVGTAIMRLGFESFEAVHENAYLEEAEMAGLFFWLENQLLEVDIVANILKTQYMQTKESLSQYEDNNNYLYQHNKTLNTYANFIQSEIEIGESQCDVTSPRSERSNEMTKYVGELSWMDILQPNYFGRGLLRSFVPQGTDGVRADICQTNELNREIQRLLLQRYE